MIAGFGGELISHAYVEHLMERLSESDGLDRAAHRTYTPRVPELDRNRDTQFERQLVRWWRHTARTLGPASGARAILDVAIVPLLELLGHERPIAQPEPYGLRSALPASNGVLLAVPWSTAPASIWRDAIRHGLSDHVAWAIICNGRSLRIVDCTRAWARSAIEFDFDRLTASPKGIAALRLLTNAAAMSGRHSPSLLSHVIASDAHASGVCRSLGDGVLAALPRLAGALSDGSTLSRCRDDAFDQALTVVYRILFLLFAEARARWCRCGMTSIGAPTRSTR